MKQKIEDNPNPVAMETEKERKNELTVFVSSQKESACDECGTKFEPGAHTILREDGADLCLGCAHLDHLVFLPSGNVALTRRAKSHSKLYAVVVKYSRRRGRDERQGLLVEDEALKKAEAECLADDEVRKQKRAREAVRRQRQDQEYVEAFAKQIRVHYPKCPDGIELDIAEHACEKHSGRVGRTAGAKEFDVKTIKLAVIAHIRHSATEYDKLLQRGYEKYDAREDVADKLAEVIEQWGGKPLRSKD
jgi:hypothetical protein